MQRRPRPAGSLGELNTRERAEAKGRKHQGADDQHRPAEAAPDIPLALGATAGPGPPPPRRQRARAAEPVLVVERDLGLGGHGHVSPAPPRAISERQQQHGGAVGGQNGTTRRGRFPPLDTIRCAVVR
ncbi:unnamed protein product [Ectocarpus sp. 8 AP-2014]